MRFLASTSYCFLWTSLRWTSTSFRLFHWFAGFDYRLPFRIPIYSLPENSGWMEILIRGNSRVWGCMPLLHFPWRGTQRENAAAPSTEFSPATRPSLVFVFLMFMAWKTVRCLIFLVAIVFAVSLFRAESEISKCCLCLLLAGNSLSVLEGMRRKGAYSMQHFMMCF